MMFRVEYEYILKQRFLVIEHLFDLEGEGLALPEGTTFVKPFGVVLFGYKDEVGVIFWRGKVSHVCGGEG